MRHPILNGRARERVTTVGEVIDQSGDSMKRRNQTAAGHRSWARRLALPGAAVAAMTLLASCAKDAPQDTFQPKGDNARNGQLFVRAGYGEPGGRGGRLNIANAQYRDDPKPVEDGCPCECCTTYSRGMSLGANESRSRVPP